LSHLVEGRRRNLRNLHQPGSWGRW